MDEKRMLEILERIEVCLERNAVLEAKEYVKIEINNIKGITKENCKKTKYHYYDIYCKYCNLNCNKAKKEEL